MPVVGQPSDPGLERIVDALIEAAVRNGRALVERNHRAASEAATDVQDAHRDLESAGRLKVVLPRLISHPEPAVRLWAAVFTRHADPELAVATLAAIEGPLADHATVMGREWQAGWAPRPEPLYRCPVCGWLGLFQVPLSHSFEICPSCGIQYGLDDAGPGGDASRAAACEAWRARWIEGGMRFWSEGEEPHGWDPKRQLLDAGLGV